MADKTTYDLIVIGGGPGGYVAAIRAAQLGMSVALVEKRSTLGGTCLNVGCIPSKALLDSSELYSRVKREAAEHGISVGKPTIDVAEMMKRKDAVVKKLVAGVGGLVKAKKVTVIHGTARLAGSGSVSVAAESGDETTLTADAIVIATGSVPVELPFLAFNGKTIVSSTEAIAFTEVPRRLVVVGAGAIGLELGSVWARLGSEVSVVEIMPEILPGWDAQIARTLRRELTNDGITFHLGTKVTGFKDKKSGVTLTAEDPDGKAVTFDADRVLVAVGRKPFTDGLGLESAGVAQEKNRIVIDEQFKTNVAGLYAIGDVVRGPMLAHKAEDEGIAVAEIIAGKPGHVNYDAIPNVVYTWPEVAAVGPTEDELKKSGVAYNSGSFPFSANGRALAMSAPTGFAKILADKNTDRVLAAHIIGPWASDLIGEIVTTIEYGGSAEDIART
ncbi:MAG: dihydrolipoyl dehydrogenase, partial [Spirochaetaceae bacterium]